MGIRPARVLVVGATIAACGRVGFESRAPGAGDAPAGDAAVDAAAPAALVAMTSQQGSATGTQLAIQRSTAGDLLVVAVVTWDGTAVTGVHDENGSAFVSAGVRAVMTNTSSELWYAAPASATSTIDVAMAGSASGYDVWVAEFANVADGPPAQTGSGCLEYPPAVVAAPVTTTVPGELVVGATMLAYPAYASAVAAPFTELSTEDGNGVAYFIADVPGSYGPSWGVGMGSGMAAMTCTSTAAFLPR